VPLLGPGLVLAPGPVGWFDSAHASSPQVLREGDRWRMWYYGRDVDFDPEITGPHARTGLAESADGIHWERVRGPLALGAVLAPHPNPDRFDSGQVGVTDVQKFDGLYWMWYLAGDVAYRDWGGKPRKSIPYQTGCAVSRDGVHWLRANPEGHPALAIGPAGAFDYHSATQARVVRLANGEWRMYYHGLHPANGGRIALATSADGLRWEKRGQILSIGEPGDFDERGVTCRSVFQHDGGWAMIYEASNNAGYYALGLARSADGVTWTKERGNEAGGAVFSTAPPGSGRWDTRAMEDNAFRLYYVGGNELSDASPAWVQAIGMAVGDSSLRRWRRWDG
jgi:hypothetical protein